MKPSHKTRSDSSDENLLRNEVAESRKNKLSLTTKPDLRYLDKWDLSTLMTENVDIPNSQANINIPLVDFAISKSLHFSLSATYNSGLEKTNGLLGNGWTLQFPDDYIILDQKETVFPSEFEYYLMVHSQSVKLKRMKSTDHLQHFQVEDDEEIRITYDPNNEQWIIDGKNLIAIYGKSPELGKEAVHRSLFWDYWRGPGKGDMNSLKSQVQAWHVISRQEKYSHKRKLFYDYITEEGTLSNGMKYTSLIQLKSIRDETNSTRLDLIYGTKSKAEFVVQNPVNFEKYLQFPIFLQSKKYLTGYELVTDLHTQKLEFAYSVRNSKIRKLTRITQLYTELGLSETLFQFVYHNEHHSMSEFYRGTDKSIKFTYSQLQIPLLDFGPLKNAVNHFTTENAQISIKSDFSVMAFHVNTNTVYISVLNKQLTSLVTKLEASDGTASDPTKHIQSFALLTFPNLIAIFAETETGRFLSTFHRDLDTNQWSKSQQKTAFTTGDLFRYSEDIMAVAKNDTAQLVVFEPDDSDDSDGVITRNITLPKGPLHRFIIQGRVILAYDGSSLFTITKDVVNEEEWHVNPSLLNVSSKEGEIHQDIYMDTEFAKMFKEQVRISGLQMVNNMALLSVVRWVSNRFSCKVSMLLMDENYETKVSTEFFTGDEKIDKHITDFVQEQKSEFPDGINYLKFRYERASSNRWQAKLFQISGLIDKELDKICKDGCPDGFREEFKRNQIIEFNKDSEKVLRKMVLFDATPCLDFQLDSKVAKTNATLISMQGSSWLQEEKDDGYGDRDPITNMPLGKDFILEGKQGRNSTVYKLFKQSLEDGSKVGAALKEFKTSQNGSIALGYPSYLAYQEEPWIQTVVLPLLSNGTIGNEIELEAGEKLMQMSNAEVILTIQEIDNPSLSPYTNKILSRRVNSVVKSASSWVVSRSEVNDNGFVRVRTYENSFASNRVNLTQENTVCVIPTGNLKYSGKYLETTIIPVDNPYNATKVTKWVDSEGNLVRSKLVEFSDKNDETEADKPDYMLFDVSGDLVISEIYPYNVTNQMVAYIGFEAYESPNISGTNLTWNFPVNSVVRNGDALTGESFLRLGEGEMFSASLTPTDQSNTYVASCWVRCEPEEKFELEAPVPYFKANLEISKANSFIGIYGQMKRVVGEWLYVEVTADLHKIRNNVYQEYYRLHLKQESLPLPNNVNFSMVLEIDPSKHFSRVVDIDHVRFIPIKGDLNMKVYDEKNGNAIATILSNGAIARKVYNVFEQEIANVDEDGQIEQLISTSYSGQIFPIPKISGRNISGVGMKSDLVIMPEWGSYEKLNLYSFSSQKWFTNRLTAWEMKNWRISHVDPIGENEIKAVEVSELFEKDSAAIRFQFLLDSGGHSKLQFSIQGGPLIELKTDMENPLTTKLTVLSTSDTFANLPVSGELIVYIENSTLWVFINGNLLVEKNLALSSPFPWSQFSMKASGLVTMSDFMILNHPQLLYEFRNGFDDRTQIIQIESENSILIGETIYDEIGREAIKTKSSRITRNASNPLFTFQENFAINKNPVDSNSVFHTGILEGLVNDLHPEDEGYCYTRKIFLKDLLREAEVDGLPGRHFSADSNFKKTFSRHSGIPFMTNLFPKDRGFMEKVMREPNGSIKVSIINKKEQEIAQYVLVPGFDDILTTFEYDKQGNLAKILPPAYHEQVNTFARATPLPIGNDGLTEEEVKWQKILCTHFIFNESNFLAKKITPDIGIQGYSYDFVGNMRFMYSLDPTSGLARNIVSFLHVSYDQPVEIGYIPGEMQIEELMKYENSTSIPGQVLHQRIIYSDFHSDPSVRNRLKLFMTYTSDSVLGLAPSENIPPPHQELVKFDSRNNVVLKTSNAVHSGFLTNLHKYYKGGKLSEIQYPRDGTKSAPLNLMHFHNKMNHLVGLGTRDNPTSFGNFSYSSSGQLSREIFEQGSSAEFSREYKYNSPGFLTKIEDPFLSQSVAFNEKGYGQNGFGDGIIMNTIFNADWPDSRVDSENFRNWFKISDDDFDKTKKMCLSALKRLGFVDESTLIPRKFLSHADLSFLPMSCSGSVGHELMKVIAAKLPPGRFYGHRYAYGNHKELQKAKYFSTEKDQIDPLQIYTFYKEISEVQTEEISEKIWDILAEHDFIITDNRRTEDKTAAIAKEGTVEIFCYEKLDSDLEEIKEFAFVYTRPIIHLLYNMIIKNEAMVDLNNFKETYVVWLGYRDTPTADLLINLAKQDAGTIYAMLSSKGYLSREISSILSENFMEKLNAYRNILPQIVKVLQSHFTTQIGRSVNDYEAYSIDANGNQKMFYVGLERHNLEHVNGTNRVSKLSVLDPYGLPGENLKVFELDHDPVGNVSKAPHRNIEEIRYHPVINRPVYIGLSDGRKLIIQYDAQGERILKRVYNKKEVLLSEVKYFRDENGQVLMDTRTKFPEQPGESVKVTTSTYLHGPRGLLGFIRNRKFYSVFTDHAGSIRLVTQGGLVVAGYDYWPYGELMKAYGEEDAHIHYRFTGQEWDEETGLYNFHARIYDPTLGRFFQPDPKAQYYSPYIYAGNSPISMVDPDGEFFLTLSIIIGVIIGGYLGGAAANGQWNPAKWEPNLKTFMGVIGGMIAGGMLPGGFVTMAGSIGIPGAILVGLGGSYLSMAKVNKSWNPAKWDWTSPGTYNAFFTGFGDGVSKGGLLGGVYSFTGVLKFGKTLTGTGQVIFYMTSFGIGGALAYVNGALANGKNFKIWEWDFGDPNTLAAMQAGFMIGSGLPQQATKIGKKLAEAVDGKTLGETLKTMRTSAQDIQIAVMKEGITHPLYKHILLGLLNYLNIVVSQCFYDHCSFDPTKWDWQSMSTYEGVLNGILKPPPLYNMVKESRKGNLQLADNKWLGKLVEKQSQTSSNLASTSSKFNLLSYFYFFSPTGRTRKNGSNNLFPIVIEMLTRLFEENEESYIAEVQHLLKGLSAGSTIYPDSSFGEYVDCSSQNSTRSEYRFEECDISSGAGKRNRQNREMIHNLFIPTSKYQSKDQFIQVEEKSEVLEEFSEYLLHTIHTASGQMSGFYYEFFVGATYNSLLNFLREQNGPEKKVFIRLENNAELGKQVLHLAFLKESTLSVRVVVVGEQTDFSRLANHIKTQKYLCQLESSVAQKVTKIEAQIYLIETSPSPKLFTMTPEVSLDMQGCSGSSKFVEASAVAGQQILKNFETFLEIGGVAEEKFKTFFLDVVGLYNNMVQLIGQDDKQSFMGFLYGLLDTNMKNTYGLQLEASVNNHLAVLSTVNGNGMETWLSPPVIMSFDTYPQDIESFLYSFSSRTLANEVIVTHVENGLASFTSVEIPQFQGFYENSVNSGNLGIVENSIKYLFYDHKEKVRDFVQDPAPTGNLHYVSNFILGEFLTQANFKEMNSTEISVFSPQVGSQFQRRMGAQRIFFIRNKDTGVSTVLNIIESSRNADPIFDPTVPTDIPVLPATVSSIRHLKIKLNTNSIGSFTGSVNSFFQGFEQLVENPTSIPVDSTSYFGLRYETEISPRKLSFEKDSVQKLFSMLSENRYKALIQSDVDFQSLASGLFTAAANLASIDSDGMKTSLRTRSPNQDSLKIETHSLLTLTKDNYVVPDGEQVLVQNLKFAKIGDDDLAKYNDTSDELKEHVCTNKESLSEFWRVAVVPAVFGPEIKNAMRFDTNPTSVLNDNCTTSTSNIWYDNLQRNRNSGQNAKSTATEASLSILPFNIIRFFSEGISNYFHSRSKTSPPPASSDNKGESKGLNDNVSTCQLGAWLDGSYSENGITCLTEISKIMVFRRIHENDVGKLGAAGFAQQAIGDAYDKSSCAPVAFNGMPSVTCKGEKTNLVYTPYLQERMFNNVDGNIMLGRVFMHLGGNLLGISKSEQNQNHEDYDVTVSDDMIDILQRRLKKVEILVEMNMGEVDWAQVQLQDCKEFINELKQMQVATVDIVEVKVIQERLTALYEDLSEQIEWVVTERSTDQNNAATDKKAYNKMSKQNIFIPSSGSLNNYIANRVFSRGNLLNNAHGTASHVV